MARRLASSFLPTHRRALLRPLRSQSDIHRRGGAVKVNPQRPCSSAPCLSASLRKPPASRRSWRRFCEAFVSLSPRCASAASQLFGSSDRSHGGKPALRSTWTRCLSLRQATLGHTIDLCERPTLTAKTAETAPGDSVPVF
jgi:hypothetical protein